MSDVKLTDRVAAVLRGVAAGQVTRWRIQRAAKPDQDRWEWAPGAHRKVGREMTILREAGFATYEMELGRSAARWKPTEAGEKWLAEHEESN